MTLNKNQPNEDKSASEPVIPAPELGTPPRPGTMERRLASPGRIGEPVIDTFDNRRVGLPEPIVWTDKYLVGVDIIDAEHHALVDLFNSILTVSKSHNHAELAILLEQLGNITATHFESEERLMAQFDYAHAAQHRLDHQKLLEEYGHQVDDWRNRHISAELLCRFMYRWLLRHVIASDMALGEAINRHAASGVSPQA